MSDPVLLIPGLMCDARLFGPQIAGLSTKNAVQIAVPTRGDTIEEMADVILADAPDRFALAGLSMGGIIAMEILRQRPDRVLRLALMDTNPLPETPEAAAGREPQIAAARAGRLDEVMRDEMKPKYLAPGDKRVEVLNLVLDMARALGPEVFVRQSRALQRRKSQQATLEAAKLPALVLCGRHDALCPVRRHKFMAGLIPGAIFEIIEEAGHLPTLEQPEETTAALQRWLTGTLLLK